MSHFKKRDNNQRNPNEFRGIEAGQRIEHAYDHSDVGVVVKIEAPLIYVQMDNRHGVLHPMDRDELRYEGFYIDQKQQKRQKREQDRKERHAED